jgi:hypothetical protein
MTLQAIQALGMIQNDKGWWMLPKDHTSAEQQEEEREEVTP